MILLSEKDILKNVKNDCGCGCNNQQKKVESIPTKLRNLVKNSVLRKQPTNVRGVGSKRETETFIVMGF